MTSPVAVVTGGSAASKNENKNKKSKKRTAEELIHSTENLLEIMDRPMAVPSILGREAFQKRLATFRSSTYFAKPIGVSPIVCARHG